MRTIVPYIAGMFFFLMPCFAQAEMKITLIAPQSGEYKIWGDELVQGAKIAIDDINKNGGVNGKKLSLEVIDDPCSENLALSTAQMISVRREKPVLVIGPYCSDGYQKIAQTYVKAKIFQIMPMMRDSENAFHQLNSVYKIGSINPHSGRDFYDFYNKHTPGIHAAVVFDPNDKDFVHAAQTAEDTFRRHGKASLLTVIPMEKDPEISAQNVVETKSKIVFILGKPKKIAKMIRFLKKSDQNITLITGRYLIGDSLKEYADGYLEDIYFMGMPAIDDEPEFAEQLVKLRLRGIDLSGLNADSFIAIKSWEEIVRQAGSASYNKVMKQSRKIGNQNPWSFSTSADHHISYVYYRFKDGEFIPYED